MVRLKGGFGGLTDRITAWVIIMYKSLRYILKLKTKP
jgi:hypothetical protein